MAYGDDHWNAIQFKQLGDGQSVAAIDEEYLAVAADVDHYFVCPNTPKATHRVVTGSRDVVCRAVSIDVRIQPTQESPRGDAEQFLFRSVPISFDHSVQFVEALTPFEHLGSRGRPPAAIAPVDFRQCVLDHSRVLPRLIVDEVCVEGPIDDVIVESFGPTAQWIVFVHCRHRLVPPSVSYPANVLLRPGDAVPTTKPRDLAWVDPAIAERIDVDVELSKIGRMGFSVISRGDLPVRRRG